MSTLGIAPRIFLLNIYPLWVKTSFSAFHNRTFRHKRTKLTVWTSREWWRTVFHPVPYSQRVIDERS
jgi:hypothetical protein